ncbi:hypothetical protein ALC60_01511 [Trachymyrmex zeteki]|uniref:CHK kinase-like domain-containing protein n=1 Tax=Mycetomoellerius zeteki TaxID=64791 RepID=A0A151XGK3_9HYME|nr:PREDICTED: uncharacterized protein LOC108729768 [Trachymyrmex zeteki]XP_018314561.1 PREDICTED: uncharacterized protein LOC108729768 [Trachymyrmex zeteki]XP_018314569.1 PREDICTED: uncharacterized protein LOC108729768 [Trachymyrmex zeteki]XP_018314578.1 PREDICTED: uncharacterized protein LOC108729768 [Trachymyrmex zeteki]XP_018314586.1 PREDICTED: uncharacterized protein LOC108729768 [Trachymyrmex zeteki]KYQ59526.1 hypothetical protein ALC60_01511 [Trachymyrmex zeteki]
MADEKIVSDERLYDYLRTYAKTIKLLAPKFHITEGTNAGDNYVSLVCRVTIEGVAEDGEDKEIQLILKTTRTLDTSEVLSSSRVTNMFQREMFFYKEVLPIFKETLKDRGGIIDRFPILYDVSDESGKEILMLENLAPQGFVMAKSKILDYPHLSLALRCLGEFHAYSFITRVANPTSFEKLKMEEHLFTERLADNNDDNKDEDVSKMLIGLVFKALANEDKHYSERYQRFLENMIQNMFNAVDGKAAEPYAVVNHGDSWTNNMLFKYDEENNPCDLRFIDLQICRYASPVLDLLYILFCCCTQETRSKYFDQVIDEYYETLSKCIKRAGYDPDILFPYEVLSEHLTKFGKYAAGMAIYTIHIFTGNVEIKNAYDNDILQERIENDSFYRNMLIGTFKDLIDRNYI